MSSKGDALQENITNTKSMEKALNRALNKACLLVENEARKNAPIDTGELRRSITHEVHNNEGIVGTNLEYAPYVEFGTGLFATDGDGRQTRQSYQDEEGNWHSTIGQKPQPYLYPALENNQQQILDIFNEELLKTGGSTNGGLQTLDTLDITNN